MIRRTILSGAILAWAMVAGVLSGATALRAAELVMVERSGCPYCARWDRDVAPAYERSPEGQRAPLRRVSLDDGQPRLALAAPVRFTPTFLLVDGNREIGRVTGFINDAMFWGLLDKLLERLGPPPQQAGE